MPGEGTYGDTKTRTVPAEELATKLLQGKIAQYDLATFDGQSYVKDTQVRFPWERMFEADFIFPQEEQINIESEQNPIENNGVKF